MVDFILEEAQPDVQNWIRNYEWPAAEKNISIGERYVNSAGNTYYVLEDAPAGQEEVKVAQNLPFGKCIKYIHKAILFS